MDKKRKILWIDDDISFYKYFKDHLEEYFDIDLVKNPDLFWDKLTSSKKGDYVCIIMDILMPYGQIISAESANGGLSTGIALLEQIKATSDYKYMPAIIFTIRDSRDVDAVGEKYGVVVVRKHEATLEEFLEAVANAIK